MALHNRVKEGSPGRVGKVGEEVTSKKGKMCLRVYIYTNPSPLEIEGASFPFSLTQLKK